LESSYLGSDTRDNLKHQYDLGDELFDLVAFTFSADLSVFSVEGSETSEDGEHGPLEAYLIALDRRDELIRAWEAFFADYDVLMVPAGTDTAPRHGEQSSDPSPLDYPYALSAVSGCPMVVIPAGIDRQGLPFGLQILGRRWDDERLLATAKLLSELTPGFQRPPDY
jgi:Asp-tRNA(Asn)/Glu-tRNA(Gln) amidotransferase A subunit family amidase